MYYRKTRVLIILTIFLYAACAVFGASAEQYIIDQVDGNWHIVCDLEAQELFGGELFQYQYKQQKLDIKKIKEQFSGIIGESVSMTKEKENASHAWSGERMHFNVPTFVSQPANLSASGETMVNSVMSKLQELDFHCYDQPFLCVTQDTLLHEMNEAGMGMLMDWERYTSTIYDGDSSGVISPDDILVVLTPEVNGYPVLPVLFDYDNEYEVPMYMLFQLRQDAISYIEMGGSYQITKEKSVQANPIDVTTAINNALTHAYSQWRSAFDSLAYITDYGFDYPAFFKNHQP